MTLGMRFLHGREVLFEAVSDESNLGNAAAVVQVFQLVGYVLGQHNCEASYGFSLW